MTDSEKISDLLYNTLFESTLFKRVSPEMVRELADKMRIITYGPGETIIKKDDEGIHMYFIVEGAVKIHDHEHLLATLGNGEFFGEMSILDREPRSMSVTAIEKTVTGSIKRDELFEVINKFPGMTVELIGFLSRRLRKLNKFMVEQLKNREKELEKLVDERTAALAKKNHELEEAIQKIRKSQQQLIMQEKLASLGSLTAGVAHELHNPLNFVNNFTELSLDLLDELRASGEKNNLIFLIDVLEKNLNKTLSHGQRAESIIKSMILHSNSGTGKKVETDINDLFEQSVEIATYTFTNTSTGCPVRIDKQYDKSAPLLKIIPRDISKVFINLLTNAFYEVNRKWKSDEKGYEPRIQVSTELNDTCILIKICDNGFGIDPDSVNKIFEPFYTSKPSGHGVGLGLSISNDIIAAHGGTIKYHRTPTDFTCFTISLPL